MAQNLTTNILINARVGNGFSKVGSTLTELGSIVDGMSQQLIDFGRESVGVYRDYEMSMRDAEVALSTTYGRGTQQLRTVMGQLDASATEWAATTIFHTNDVANAISEAAHAGWDYDQIMSGIPAAMRLAQAGGLDLSEAVNYIVKATNAAGIGFEDLGEFVDLWTFGANKSASTIGEFGEAMLRMGSTMRFAADPAELMTLIAATADAGAVGSEAGTMVRNSVMRMIAPTQKASEAMELLGATSEEVSDLMNDEALAAANAELASRGFTVFDEGTGEMRPILDIYTDLAACLADIAGGYENISSNDEALGILSAIFPTRTITEALNLVNAAANGWDGLYDAMKGGDASGYGEYAAETMMDTLGGDIEIFESKVERLKQVVGGELADDVSGGLEFFGGVVDSLAEMDEDKLDMLIGAAEALAAAGPGLLLAGGAFRLIGFAMNPIGGATTALLALGGAVAALNELEASNFADNFGDMELDIQPILNYVHSLGDEFRESYEDIDAWHTAMDQAVESYKNASSQFSGTLMTKMLTGAQLTPEDEKQLEGLGDDMSAAVLAGIEGHYSESGNFWRMLFGGEGTAEKNEAYQGIIETTNSAYEEAIAEAESIGQGLREAMTAAFADGQINDEEYQNILSYVKDYNAALARATAEAEDEESQIRYQMMLNRGQIASLDEMEEISQAMAEERDANLAKLQEDYEWNRAELQVNGGTEEELAAADEAYQAARLKEEARYAGFATSLWDSQIRQNGLAENYDWLSGVTDAYLSGGITADTADELITEQLGKSKYAGQSYNVLEIGDAISGIFNNTAREDLGQALGRWLAAMGGEEAVEEQIGYLRETGEQAMADMLAQMYGAAQLVNDFEIVNYNGKFTTTGTNERIATHPNRSSAEETLLGDQEFSADAARQLVETLGGEDGVIGQYLTALGESVVNDELSQEVYSKGSEITGAYADAWEGLVDDLEAVYDFGAVLKDNPIGGVTASEETILGNDLAAYQLMYGGIDAEQYRIQVEPELDAAALEAELGTVAVPIDPYVEGEDPMAALQEQGVDVSVGADATELSATIDGEDGQTLLEYVDGDATDLQMEILDQDGRTLQEWVTGDASQLERIINSYSGRVVTVNIRGRQLFAEGGRATSASIFGEAGPEWAIPEEHSERTAELLNAARAASGFTWPDLLERFGGLNADSGHTPSTFVYSPVIYAQDARGVETALQEDKMRMEKWWADKQLHDKLEVYS